MNVPLYGICWDNWRCRFSQRKITSQTLPERITTKPEIQICFSLGCCHADLFNALSTTICWPWTKHPAYTPLVCTHFFWQVPCVSRWSALLVNDLDGGLEVSCRDGNFEVMIRTCQSKTVHHSVPVWPLGFPVRSWSHSDPTRFTSPSHLLVV